jgi:Zn-dependent M16 (insulinase) family peptidase
MVQLSPEEQQRLHEAMQKAQQDPAVREAHEHAAKAQQIAMEAQKKAHEITDDAARRADPSIAPILEKIRKAMEARQNRQPNQPTPGNGPQSNHEPKRVLQNNQNPENNHREDNKPRNPDASQRVGSNENPFGGNRVVKNPNQPTPENNNHEVGKNSKSPQRQDPLAILSPDEQRRVREAMGKANSDPSLKEAREAAAAAQKKVMELTEELARKADPEIAPLLDKVRKAMEARRNAPVQETNRNRKQGE